jgi:hypothetical protein
MSTALAPEIATDVASAHPSRLDIVMGILAVMLVGGFFVDLWARLLAVGVPAIWYGAYLVAVAVTQDGLGWSIHMIIGAPVIAGVVGMLLSVLVFPPHRPVPAA